MINRQKLLTDLQSILRKLEADLLERTNSDEVPEVGEWLRAEYQAAKDAERTAQTFKAWLDDFITQVAAAWVLSCVFARFLEDNELVDPPRIAGTGKRLEQARDEHTLFFQDAERAKLTDREYLLDIFAGLAKLPAGKDVFGPHNPMNALPNWLGPDAAGELLRFFQKIDSDSGELVHDFTSRVQGSGSGVQAEQNAETCNLQPETSFDTRFLGDLYQDLSEAARKKYALLQTPDFVEEFILDRTLDPALDEFGLVVIDQSSVVSKETETRKLKTENYFKMIDPACGSGHFLLGAFPRILGRWQKQEPGAKIRDLVQRTLHSIHGVDVNPYAIAIAGFRLWLAALRACGINKLKDAPAFELNLACGDSLWHAPLRGTTRVAKGQREFTEFSPEADDEGERHTYFTEDAARLTRLLRESQYHCVVANPPYIVPKDRALNQDYRNRYETCHMKYSLAVPFMERILRLAICGETEPRPSGSGTRQPLPDGRGSMCAGFTGQITANSFMKREFGKKLIESWFPTINLTHVIDTSGAYIPGHGTPTVILFARNQKPVGDTIRTVMGIRGEPSTPDDPSRGLVWTAIVEQIDQPGSQSEFLSVGDSSRDLFHKHPWSIGGGGAAELKEQLEEGTTETLSSLTDSIGFASFPGTDEVFLVEPMVLQRVRVTNLLIRPAILGDNVRDWTVDSQLFGLVPFDGESNPIPLQNSEGWGRYLWHYRTTIGNVISFGGKTRLQCGDEWWTWYRWVKEKYKCPLSITFGEVATHNHFVLDRGGKVFKQTAPVIKLPAMIEEPRPLGSGIGETPLPDGRGSRPVTEDDHLALLGLLNSSTACFWMKQVCHNKGSTVDQHGARQRTSPFEDFYAFNGTKLKEFPLPEERPLLTARLLDNLATRAQEFQPASIASCGAPTRAALATAQSAAEFARSQMIAYQEELDWECYRLYGLIADDLTYQGIQSRDRQGAVGSATKGEDRSLTVAASETPGAEVFDHAWQGARRTIPKAEIEPQPFFITFTCYGTWLHGDARGSIDREHNEWQTPPLEPDEERERREFALLKHSPVKLGQKQRLIVHRTIEEVCQYRGWHLHALNVRTNHVQAVVTANRRGKRVYNDFKSYATRRMKEAVCLPESCLEVFEKTRAQSRDGQGAVPSDEEQEYKVWTRGGSARPLDTENSFRRAIEYVMFEQGADITPGVSNADRFQTCMAPEVMPSRDREGAVGLANKKEREDDSLTVAAPGLALGQRAFEIVLARKMVAGETQTTWFERHGSTPITELPGHWPDDYKRLVERRIGVIETNSNIALIEQPEYKRRWNTESWDSQVERALRSWLLDRLESYFDFDGRMREPQGASRGSSTDDAPAASALPLTPLADIQFVSIAKLADIARQDKQFMDVAEVYRDDPAFDVQRLVEELVQSEHVPLLPVLRYKSNGLRNRAEWEKTWELQRLEDRLLAEDAIDLGQYDLTDQQRKEIGEWQARVQEAGSRAQEDPETRNLKPQALSLSIPVPPKYKSSDFISSGGVRYWSLRGKLDVPKERWVSFPHCDGPDGTLMIAWAGYNHLQLAQAISAWYVDVQERLGGRDDPRLIPLLAGVIELLPWLRQWHHEIDPEYNQRMDEVYEGFVTEEAKGLNLTIEEIKAWEPPQRTGGQRRSRKTS